MSFKLNQLKEQKARLDREIVRLEEYIKTSPGGSLISRTEPSGNISYSCRKPLPGGKKKETYINRKDIALAEKLAARDYAKARLKDVKNEKAFIEHQIRYLSRPKETDQYLLKHPRQAQLIIDRLKPKDEYARKWMEADYIRSNKYPEALIYPTILPELKVRSKSEADIAGCLVHNEVAFRYEELNIVNGIALHPDFTCLNARTREIFFIEHQGRWDDPKYVADVRWREDQYLKAGIYPWKQLLITTETEKMPFDINWFQQIVDYYLK